jgi:hypothetical protein
MAAFGYMLFSTFFPGTVIAPSIQALPPDDNPLKSHHPVGIFLKPKIANKLN